MTRPQEGSSRSGSSLEINAGSWWILMIEVNNHSDILPKHLAEWRWGIWWEKQDSGKIMSWILDMGILRSPKWRWHIGNWIPGLEFWGGTLRPGPESSLVLRVGDQVSLSDGSWRGMWWRAELNWVWLPQAASSGEEYSGTRRICQRGEQEEVKSHAWNGNIVGKCGCSCSQ